MNPLKSKELLERLEHLGTPTKRCLDSVWMSPDGEMYRINGPHDAVFSIMDDLYNPIELNPLLTNMIFQRDAGAIRISCIENEVSIELNKDQDLPTESQEKSIIASFCDDNKKQYFVYDFSELHRFGTRVSPKHNMETIFKDRLENKQCDRAIKQIFTQFSKFKHGII